MDSYLRSRFLRFLKLDLEVVQINERAAIRRVPGVAILGPTLWADQCRIFQLSRKRREMSELRKQL